MSCYAAVSPYKYSYGSFLFYSLHLIHCLPKVGLHALYMVNSVLYSSERKGLSKEFAECRTNYLFLTSLKTFYFFRSLTETNYFFSKK